MINRNKIIIAAVLFAVMAIQGVVYAEKVAGAKESDGGAEISFHERIEYAGIAARDPESNIWGCSPVKGDDGKYHLFGARFGRPFRRTWRYESHIVHFVSDTPQGPFKFIDVVYRGERKQRGQWNYFGIHNPCIKKVDGKYVLLFIGNSGAGNSSRPANQSIGMMTADSVNGPWSEPKQILKPSPDPGHWTYQAGTGVCNPAFVKFQGKYYLYFKAASKDGMRYGVAIADKLEGPYIAQDEPATDNKALIEDGTAFVWNGKVYLLTTDNHGNIIKGGGVLWESSDGLRFGSPTLAYTYLTDYLSKDEFNITYSAYAEKARVGRGGLARPQILVEEGRPAWLYAPSASCEENHKYSKCHVFRILSDESVIEKRKTKTEGNLKK